MTQPNQPKPKPCKSCQTKSQATEVISINKDCAICRYKSKVLTKYNRMVTTCEFPNYIDRGITISYKRWHTFLPYYEWYLTQIRAGKAVYIGDSPNPTYLNSCNSPKLDYPMLPSQSNSMDHRLPEVRRKDTSLSYHPDNCYLAYGRAGRGANWDKYNKEL